MLADCDHCSTQQQPSSKIRRNSSRRCAVDAEKTGKGVKVRFTAAQHLALCKEPARGVRQTSPFAVRSEGDRHIFPIDWNPQCFDQSNRSLCRRKMSQSPACERLPRQTGGEDQFHFDNWCSAICRWFSIIGRSLGEQSLRHVSSRSIATPGRFDLMAINARSRR